MFLRDLDVFFLGTAMVYLLFPVERSVPPPCWYPDYLLTLKSLSALNFKLTGVREQSQLT